MNQLALQVNALFALVAQAPAIKTSGRPTVPEGSPPGSKDSRARPPLSPDGARRPARPHFERIRQLSPKISPPASAE